MRAKRFSTSPREKPGLTTQLQWECGIPPLSLPSQASSVPNFGRALRVETISTLCSGLNILLRVLVNSSLFNIWERITDKSFFAPYCTSTWQPCFFSIINMCCTSAPSRFGCWYKIHNGCQNLQFSLLFYEVRQYYMHWYIPFSQLKTFSFEPDRLRESWFCNLACETRYEGAGG